jgi:hypothetical protein
MLTSASALPAPSSVPTTSLVPYAQFTSMVAPVPKVALPRREDDVSMGSCPVMPTPSPAAITPQGMHTSADFLKSFPWSQDQTKATLKLWLGEATHRKIPFRHFVTAIRHAGCVALLSKTWFLNFACPFLPYIPTAPCPSKDWPSWD